MRHFKATMMSDDLVFATEATELRGELLLKLEAASSIPEFADFQACLKGEIVSTEERQKRRQSVDIKEHLRRLRLLGDSLAWTLLHPHAIRNLAKNDDRPPALCDRKAEVDKCIATVRWLATKGIPGIVADLTHCIRIGDVIVVRNPEMPDLVEFKANVPDDRYRHQGRRGRQLHRMQKTVEYLKSGSAEFRNEPGPRLSIEVGVRPEHDFVQVERVASAAIRDGASLQMLRPRQWIGACRLDCEPIFPAELHEFPDLHICVGFLSEALPNLLHEVPPPFNWPINLEVRRALMDGTVGLFHILDPQILENPQIRFAPDRQRDGVCFEVHVDGGAFSCSDYFLRPILYGFQTVESVAETMVACGEGI
jgi:hypothetical protein